MKYSIGYFGAGAPVFYRPHAGRIEPCERHQIGTLAIVVDVADETEVVNSMPLVRGSGNAALLRQRRLEREFPGVTLKAALPLRNRPGDGLTDLVLMSTDSTDSLSAELGQLSHDTAVRGIYTPAMLAAHWMKRAGLLDRKVLIAMPTPAGLRLTFVDHCCPLLSRLVPHMASDSLATELGRTIQYLHNSQRLSRDTRLELWFWGMDEASISASLPTEDNYDLGAAPNCPGLPDPEITGFDALLTLAAIDPPSVQLAPHQYRAGWFAQQLRRWGFGAAAAVLLLGAVVTGWLLTDATRIRSEADGLSANDAAYQEQRQLIESQLSASGVSLEELLALPRIATRLDRSEVKPAEAMQLAASTLGSRSELLIQSLEFQSGPVGQEAPATNGGCTSEITPGSPVFEATFRLDESLAVRAGADALSHVRRAVSSASPWHPTAASAALGELQPLATGSQSDGSTHDSDWLTCLWREVPT